MISRPFFNCLGGRSTIVRLYRPHCIAIPGAARCALALALLGLWPGNPSIAENVQFRKEDLRQNSIADRIYICSNIPEISEQRVHQFFSEVFPGWTNPVSTDGQDFNGDAQSRVAVWIVTDGAIQARLETCMSKFEVLFPEIRTLSMSTSNMLDGNILSELGVSNAEIYAPPKSAWSYRANRDDLLVVLASKESEPYRSSRAIASFFGLDASICDRIDACER